MRSAVSLPASFLLALGACIPNIPRGTAAVDAARVGPRLVAMTDPAAADVYLSATVRAGSASDPIGQEGLAALTARAMVEAGAGSRDAAAIREVLYGVGNDVEVVVDKDLVTFRLRCYRDQVAVCAEVFGDVLAAPMFAPNEVQRLRDETVHLLSDGAAGDEEALAWQVLDSWIFEGRPYGHPVSGRHGVLSLVDAGAVRSFWREHYLRASTVIGVAGAADEAVAAGLVERLGAMGTTLAPYSPLMTPMPVEGLSLRYVDTGSDVVGFRFGHPVDITREHPDWPALTLAMTAFGAHRQSFGVLFQSLRATRGLNYGTYAYIEPFIERSDAALAEQGTVRRQGLFHVWIRPTSIENGPFALKLAMYEVRRLAEDGLTAEQFDDIRSYLRGALPLMAQDPGRRLAYAVEAVAGGQPDPLRTLADALDSLTLEQVNAAVHRHLRPDDLKIVAVGGSPDRVIDRLVADLPTPVTYQGVNPDAGQAAVDALVAATPVRLPRERVQVVEAAAVFR